jgi:hypothetical protein
MKWRSHADDGLKHETADWMHSELDDQRHITEAAELKVLSRNRGWAGFLVADRCTSGCAVKLCIIGDAGRSAARIKRWLSASLPPSGAKSRHFNRFAE